MYQPKALPTKASEAKCLLLVTRVSVTAEARPYANSLVSGPGYSCANTPAADQARIECSDGKEFPPRKNAPCPFPSSGRSRCEIPFNAKATAVLSTMASAARNPVPLTYSFPLRCPHRYEAPAA